MPAVLASCLTTVITPWSTHLLVLHCRPSKTTDRRTRLDRNQRGHKYAEYILTQALSGTPLVAAAQCPTGDGRGGEDGTTEASECHKGAVPPPSSPHRPSLESASVPSATATAEPLSSK